MKRQFSFSVTTEDHELPQERLDQDDGDPFREFSSSSPAATSSTQVDPAEQHRALDIRDCCHRIRGDWCRNLNATTVNKDDTRATEESNDEVTQEDDTRAQSDDQDDIGVGVCASCCAFLLHALA